MRFERLERQLSGLFGVLHSTGVVITSEVCRDQEAGSIVLNNQARAIEIFEGVDKARAFYEASLPELKKMGTPEKQVYIDVLAKKDDDEWMN